MKRQAVHEGGETLKGGEEQREGGKKRTRGNKEVLKLGGKGWKRRGKRPRERAQKSIHSQKPTDQGGTKTGKAKGKGHTDSARQNGMKIIPNGDRNDRKVRENRE